MRLLAYLAAAILFASYAVASSQDPSYDVFSTFLSGLGTGPWAAWFNASLLVSSALLLLFFSSLASGSSGNARLGALSGTAASAGIAAVGIFPADVPLLHVLAAEAFFTSALAAWALLTFFSGRSPSAFSLVTGGAFAVSAVALGLTMMPFFQIISVTAFLLWVVSL